MHRILVWPPPSAAGAVAVAGGEPGGLPHQGPTLLLALEAPIGVIRRGGRRSKSSGASA
jgi:hypothetical protein